MLSGLTSFVGSPRTSRPTSRVACLGLDWVGSRAEVSIRVWDRVLQTNLCNLEARAHARRVLQDQPLLVLRRLLRAAIRRSNRQVANKHPLVAVLRSVPGKALDRLGPGLGEARVGVPLALGATSSFFFGALALLPKPALPFLPPAGLAAPKPAIDTALLALALGARTTLWCSSGPGASAAVLLRAKR